MKSAKNDVTGDSIRTKASNHNAYSDGWERIFGKKNKGTRALSDSSVRRGIRVTVKPVEQSGCKNNSGIV